MAGAQPAAPIVVALPTSSAMEAHQAPAAVEAQPEAEVAAPQRESAAVVAQPAAGLPCRRRSPPSPAAPRRRRWRFPTTTPRRLGGTSGEVFPRQPPSLRRGARQTVGRPHGGWGLEARCRGLFVPRRTSGSSGPAADSGQEQERVDAPSPLFVDTQEEQQLWEELRGHGASLNRALNNALRIHGSPTWHVFQVRLRRSARLPLFFFGLVVFVFVFSVWHSWVSSADSRSWSSTPATGTTPSTR
jgi:hypothetical protein